MNQEQSLPVALTIAGSDSGAGAGIQADLLTFSAHDVFGTTAVTCLTAQNPSGVAAIAPMEPSFVREQIEQVFRFFGVDALKTGMLYSREIIHEVAAFLERNRAIPAVIDPVMVATSGAVLLKDDALSAIQERLLPLATVVTPNLDEVAVLIGQKPQSIEAMQAAGAALAEKYRTAFLIKGGHLESERITDVLVERDGTISRFSSDRVFEVDTHGSGCILSSAIAARLAYGEELTEAVRNACTYMHAAIYEARVTRTGRYINPFPGQRV